MTSAIALDVVVATIALFRERGAQFRHAIRSPRFVNVNRIAFLF
jgi:hypothetical protein